MKKSSKKFLAFSMITVAFIVILLLYFKPLPLSDLIDENNEISVIKVEAGIENGKPYTNSIEYNDISNEQKNNMISLLEHYSYKRTFGTMISDGSLPGRGAEREEIIYIFVYENDALVNRIKVSTTGDIAVNDKTYRLQSASEFIDKLLEIISN